jgi:alkylation response protein AidB-like acyl-CoA dehydrogenase
LDLVLHENPDLTAFRHDVASWFSEHTPADWERRVDAMDRQQYVAFSQQWLRTLGSRGFGAPHVPREWGGGGYSVREQAILYEEWARAGAPGVDLFVVSLFHVPTTLLIAGSPRQQREYVRAAVTGTVWCQGFSEPSAGSDLASLRTRAEPADGGWRVTGQKIWSSNADAAEYCILLARTDPDSHGSRGISYFVLDMRQPGVEVRPIKQNSGHQEFCEIFLDGALIPAENVLGEVGQGWRVAQSTLAAERGPTGLEITERIAVGLSHLIGELDARRKLAVTAELSAVEAELAALSARTWAVRSLALDTVDALERGDGTGSLASVLKIAFTELLQEVTECASRRSGERSLVDPRQRHHRGWITGDWALDWFGSWGWTIAAGTNEIQRNIIGEQLLGLPREPKVLR